MPTENHTNPASEAPDTPPWDYYSFDTLINSEHAQPEHAVEDLLVEGHHGVLAGPFSVGKTYLSLQLSVSLATGAPFMGRNVRRAYRVSFIDLENGAAEIKTRMIRMPEASGLSEDARVLLAKNWIYNDATEPDDPLYGLSLDPKGFGQLEKHVFRTEPDVVIIDCYGKAVPWAEKDEEKVKALLANIARLQKTYPPLRRGLFLQLHHPIKPSSEAPWPNLLDQPPRVAGTCSRYRPASGFQPDPARVR